MFRLQGKQQTVQAWLNSLDLEACEDALKELGYDQMDLIVDGDEEEVADIIAAFDNVSPALVIMALEHISIHPYLIAAVLKEVWRPTVMILLDDVESSMPQSLERSIP